MRVPPGSARDGCSSIGRAYTVRRVEPLLRIVDELERRDEEAAAALAEI